MIKNIKEIFSTFYIGDGEYWNFKAPIYQGFIDSSKTPLKLKRLFIQTFIDESSKLINSKKGNYKVVFSLEGINNLFYSQLTVFFDIEYYNNFFDRNNDYQKWILLDNERNIIKELNLKLPANMNFKGYKEIINDEGDIFESEIWFIGEL